jgi:hypothetical protein
MKAAGNAAWPLCAARRLRVASLFQRVKVMTVRLLVLFTACIATLIWAGEAQAMTYQYRMVGDQIVIDAQGTITYDEATQYDAWSNTPSIKSAWHGREPVAFIFNSYGGATHGGAQLGAFIFSRDIRTGVAPGGECSSACVMIWASGWDKSMAPNARIGVHQSRAPTPTEIVSERIPSEDTKKLTNNKNTTDFVATDFMTTYLRARSAPDSVIKAQRSTPPNRMYWLRPADLAAWRVRVAW